VALLSRERQRHRVIELAGLIRLLRAEGVAHYLEIGARTGDSFEAILRALPIGSRGLAVDLPEGPWGMDSRLILRDTVGRLNRDGYRCEVVFGASQSARVIGQVTQQGPYDAIFIDADHRYEAVAADWETYGPLGRLVAFHDIAGVGMVDTRTGFPVEVPRLWHEIKGQYRHQEIVAPDSELGIGVVYPGALTTTPASDPTALAPPIRVEQPMSARSSSAKSMANRRIS
jgi:predicted O-methyltransferase YrrM